MKNLQGRPNAQFIIHVDRGFSLYDSALAKPLWSYTFDKLKGSTDDGHRILYFDFGGDEIELEMEVCPKIIVFILHNCLSAKVHSLP